MFQISNVIKLTDKASLSFFFTYNPDDIGAHGAGELPTPLMTDQRVKFKSDLTSWRWFTRNFFLGDMLSAACVGGGGVNLWPPLVCKWTLLTSSPGSLTRHVAMCIALACRVMALHASETCPS